MGDSITLGKDTRHPATDSYPAQLGRALGSKYVVKNFGVSGATLLNKGDKPYREQPEFGLALAFNPNVIVIALGTNDTKPQNWIHDKDFLQDYGDLIAQLRRRPATGRILICQPIPAWPPSNWGISPELIAGEIYRLIAEVARRESVELIDLHTPMVKHQNYVPDHVHPDTPGAAVIAKTVFKAIR